MRPSYVLFYTHMIYAYYYKHFVLHFCLSLHQPQTRLHQLRLGGVKLIRITYFLQLGRKNKALLFRAFFLLLLAFAKKGVIKWLFQNHYTYTVNYARTSLFRFYEKFIILVYAQLSRKPLPSHYGVNDSSQFTIKQYTSPEEYFFGLHLTEKMFRGYLTLTFFLSPKYHIDCYLHRNLLRMLNLPLQMHRI